MVTATWDDVPHLTPKQKEDLWTALKPHERQARSKGIPALGEGAIFPVEDDSILEDPFEIPKYWRQLGAMDFGYDHPFAAVKLAHDLDKDCIHLTAEYRERQATPVIHAGALRPWGDWLRWSWPHDGLQHDKGSGEQLAQQYRNQKMNLLPERATFDDGSFGVEAGISEMLVRMQTGRFKVFRTCPLFMEEKRLYHRKKTEGGRVEIVKLRDDILSAARYGVMMIRFADIEQYPDDEDDHDRQRAADTANKTTGY